MDALNYEELKEVWATAMNVSVASPSIKILARQSRERRFDAGHSLIHQGDTTSSVFLVLEGDLKVVWYTKNGHEIWLSDLRTGNLAGETAALFEAPRSSSVVPRTNVRLAEISREGFHAAFSASSVFAHRVAEILAKRVQATSQQVVGLVGLPLASRLHVELQRLGRPDEDDEECIVLLSPPTVSMLAEQIHASREATSRAMSTLLKRGLISRQKNAMQIIVPQSL